ncbi:MAG: ribosome recycling factor [Anaerolineae bacterium]|jgi:ribosome recycling factor|nr:ribosome recycling factor [Anaerolineae bacterium]
MLNEIVTEARTKMQSTVHVFEEDLHGMRSNRASPALVDRLKVDYYGQETELRQLATISTPEPMQIMIRPFDKGATKAIEKAIHESNIGLNPSIDSGIIRLNMPPLTRERRLELVKVLHRRTEEARVAIRNIRRSANDDIKDFEKEGEISEDDAERGQTKIQELTDDFIKKIEELSKHKETDIMAI